MYYLVYGLLYLFSLLPLRILFIISDFSYLIVYYMAKYRKKVVMDNLLRVFPDKSQEERTRIAKKFYRNFCDNFIEMIKLVSASRHFIARHFIGDFGIFDKLDKQGKKGLILITHNFNWELALMAVAQGVKQKFLVVYMPIGNKVLNRVFCKTRSKTGAILLPSTSMQRAIMPYRNDKYLLVLVADQNPRNPSGAYWLEFFGKPAPFMIGPERLARYGNIPTMFFKFNKIKRGYYQLEMVNDIQDPADLAEGELTGRYMKFLGGFLREHPELWLWSHRRWKHEWKPEYGPILK